MRGVVGAALGLALAGSAWAAGAVKPPATLDARGIDDWRKANIQAEGWALMQADGAALTYAGGGAGVVRDKDGFLHVDVRREYYQPLRLGPQPSRSNVQAWTVDCELKRLRITAMSFWKLNNMQGTGFRKSADAAGWMAVEPSDLPLVDRICAAAPRSN